MIAISGALIFAGYQLVSYGWSQVQGSNAGFFDILWPGRYKGNAPDGGSATSSGSSSTSSGATGGSNVGKTFDNGKIVIAPAPGLS